MELENRIEMLEKRIIELEKVNEFQDRESEQFATKDEVQLNADINIAYTDQLGKSPITIFRRLLRRNR